MCIRDSYNSGSRCWLAGTTNATNRLAVPERASSVPCNKVHDRVQAMTWSIVARDPGGALGVAVASRFFAVGVLCAHARAGAGALATQALVNPGFGPAGLDLLAQGRDAASVVERPVAGENCRDVPQVPA